MYDDNFKIIHFFKLLKVHVRQYIISKTQTKGLKMANFTETNLSTIPLVTVIVPIYNTGQPLYQCINSILEQTYTNLDVLLINDGSTDQSARICEEYAQKDKRVRVIHKKLGGGGVGAARNTALSYIRGEYVVFVDHDDWLEKTNIAELYSSIQATNSDIAIANFYEFHENDGTFRIHCTDNDYFQKTYSPQEWFSNQYNGQYSLSQCFTVPWCKLYKASLFENVIYPENEKVEDDYTTWKLYLKANQIVFTNKSMYAHRKHAASVTKTVEVTSVFPLRSVQERIAILSLLGWDISEELSAYRWRLNLHKEAYFNAGYMQEYKKCLQLEQLLEQQ